MRLYEYLRKLCKGRKIFLIIFQLFFFYKLLIIDEIISCKTSCFVIKKFRVSSLRRGKMFSAVSNTRARKIRTVAGKIDQSSLLGILMRPAGLKWQIQKLFNIVGYSERNPTNRPRRDVIVMRRTYDQHGLSEANVNLSPSLIHALTWRRVFPRAEL